MAKIHHLAEKYDALIAKFHHVAEKYDAVMAKCHVVEKIAKCHLAK